MPVPREAVGVSRFSSSIHQNAAARGTPGTTSGRSRPRGPGTDLRGREPRESPLPSRTTGSTNRSQARPEGPDDDASQILTSYSLSSMLLTMIQPKTPRRSALGLTVLWQLMNEPMHVYRMQKLFEAQGKDRVVNVRARASLYQTIDRLQRHGLVEVSQTTRVEGYPDRVEYAITDAGREVARQWLREMLRGTEGEYPEFIAALSILFGLEPQEARSELELRAEQLAAALAETESVLTDAPGRSAAAVLARGGIPPGAAAGRARLA